MVMTKGVSGGSMVVGILLLVLTFSSVLCGGVAIGVVNSIAGTSVGLWGLYFAIPGVISILAGYKKLKNLLAVALGTHILGIILGIIGAIIAAALWHVTGAKCVDKDKISYTYTYRDFNFKSGYCYCTYDNTVYEYPADCSELETVNAASAAVMFIFILATIICFIGSIQGCAGTCYAPREPIVIVTTAQQPNTVVMMTEAHPTYNQQPPPYGQAQGVIETKG